MSVTIFRTNKIVFYVDHKMRNSIIKKTIINKYNIPIEDKRSKITFTDKKPTKKRATKTAKNVLRTSISVNTPSQKETSLSQITLFNEEEIQKKEKVLTIAPIETNITTTEEKQDPLILVKYETPKLTQTPGKLKQLKFGHTSQYENVQDKWEPFICKIYKRLFSKKLGRYILEVGDGDDSIHKVHIASQLFTLIKNNIINIGDWIKVNHYSATNLSYDKPRIIMVVDIDKIDTYS